MNLNMMFQNCFVGGAREVMNDDENQVPSDGSTRQRTQLIIWFPRHTSKDAPNYLYTSHTLSTRLCRFLCLSISRASDRCRTVNHSECHKLNTSTQHEKRRDMKWRIQDCRKILYFCCSMQREKASHQPSAPRLNE